MKSNFVGFLMAVVVIGQVVVLPLPAAAMVAAPSTVPIAAPLGGTGCAAPIARMSMEAALRLVQTDSSSPEARLALGQAYLNQGSLARAVREFSEAIRLNPNLAEAYRLRATVYDALDSFGRALADYNRAIILEPNDACTYNDRAVTLEAAGFQEAALASYSQALAIDPALAAPMANRAFLLADLGRYTEALTDFDQALALNPADTQLRKARAQIRHRLRTA